MSNWGFRSWLALALLAGCSARSHPPPVRGAAKIDAGRLVVDAASARDASWTDAGKESPQDAAEPADADVAIVIMRGGLCDSGMPGDGRPTNGPLACIVERHNAARATVDSATPLRPITWNTDVALYAQAWAEMVCGNPRLRPLPQLNGMRLGENFYAGFGILDGGQPATEAMNGWLAERECWTYGTFMSGDVCDTTCINDMHSNTCGNYTQIVWRDTKQVGCGIATCDGGSGSQEAIVVCDYAPGGNLIGTKPY